MRIYGIDPGLANTGVVLLVGDTIDAVATLKTPAEGTRSSFASVVERSKAQARGLLELLSELGPADAVAVEGYRDIPGHLRGARDRWKTPLAIGACLWALDELGPIYWQDPEQVMTLSRQTIARWEAGQSLITGDELLTNEHLRSAAAHALFLRAVLRRNAS